MPQAALALVLCSAAIHAGWNALAKRSRNKFAFIWLAFLGNMIWQLPYVVVCFMQGTLSLAAWPWMLATTVAHAFYIWLLSEAYRLGDYSLAYPISRGLGVALLPLGGWLLMKEQLSQGGLTGVCLVIGGILFVGLSSGLGVHRPSVPAVLAAIGTGISVASYSLIDRGALAATGTPPLAWISVMMVLQTLALLPFMLRRMDEVRREWHSAPWAVVGAACGALLSYLLVLHAFSMAQTAYVVASRETSIVFSVFIGSFALREAQFRRRLTGAVCIVAGVALIALLG